jgi:hypothetical protein
MVVEPVFPSIVAMMLAVPCATPVTVPLDVPFGATVATAVLLELQLTARPESVAPLASFATAVTVVVWFTAIVVAPAVTITESTGTRCTTTVAVPVFVSLVAVMIVLPESTPVTRPVLELTVAFDGLDDVQVTTRPVSTKPVASLSVSASVKV